MFHLMLGLGACVSYLKLSSQRRKECKQLHGESNSDKHMPGGRKTGCQTYRRKDGGVQGGRPGNSGKIMNIKEIT